MNAIPRVLGYAVLAAFFGGLMTLTITEWNNASIRQIVLEHFRVVVLLPAAGLFAFLLIAIFESTSGKISFSALGVKFEGAAGPILMWVICFLSITVSISILW